MRTGGDEFSLLQQLSLKGAMAVLVGDEKKPHFCWDPADEEYKDPEPTTFASS